MIVVGCVLFLTMRASEMCLRAGFLAECVRGGDVALFRESTQPR